MSYSRVANHGAMLFDATRNQAYRDAITQNVGPGSVVLDLGAGLGIHGLLAAAAGAKRVYLVEPQPVVHEAMEVARAAGLGDRVVVLQGRIEDVLPPEPVDLIVSVFTGNLLFSEDLLPSLFHARDHWLRPGGTLLPARAQLWLAPLQASGLHDEYVARWSQPVMGMDYSRSRRFAANEILWLRREELSASVRLGDGAAVAEVDLTSATTADCQGQAACEVTQSGQCHGLLGWTRIQLGTSWLSTGPEAAPVHWSPAVLPLDPPLPLEAGEQLHISLQRPAFGEWSWTVQARAGTRRHSTFLSRSEGPRELARAAPGGRPGLDAPGRRALTILQGLQQGLRNQAIADQLAAEGVDAAQALREVQALALRYGGHGA